MGMGIASLALTCGFTAITDKLWTRNKNALPQTTLADLPEFERKLQTQKYIPGEKEKEEKPRGMSLGKL